MQLLNENTLVKPDSMYHTNVLAFTGTGRIDLPEYSTAYGYIREGTVTNKTKNGIKTIIAGEYFCITGEKNKHLNHESATGFIVVRYGFKGQNVVGGPIEDSGRLVYINGCSDSILVYPPRMGDPSLNHLHFPQNIEQDLHIHPSIRIGMVVNGEGIAHYRNGNVEKSYKLVEGTVFIINEREKHRFCTTNTELNIIAFHPDGDWGPTDKNHPMKSRTYISE